MDLTSILDSKIILCTPTNVENVRLTHATDDINCGRQRILLRRYSRTQNKTRLQKKTPALSIELVMSRHDMQINYDTQKKGKKDYCTSAVEVQAQDVNAGQGDATREQMTTKENGSTKNDGHN